MNQGAFPRLLRGASAIGEALGLRKILGTKHK
jgi:hypothetical protein